MSRHLGCPRKRGIFTVQISTHEALDKLRTGIRTSGGYNPHLDLGTSAIHLVSEREIDIDGRVRGYAWTTEKRISDTETRITHHALLELPATVAVWPDQADQVAERFSAKVQRGPFPIPASVQHITGPFVELPARPAPPPRPQRAAPTTTLADLLARKAEIEANREPIVKERAERKQRLDTATSALKNARAAYTRDDSEANAGKVEAAEREVRLATLREQSKPGLAVIDREHEAVLGELRAVLSSQLHFPGVFETRGTFDQLARCFYTAPGTSWQSHGPREGGHAVLAFDVGPLTRIELQERVKHRAIAHSIQGGWRVTFPLSRPVTDGEIAALGRFLQASQFYSDGTVPALGTTRILEVDEYGPLNVDVALQSDAERPSVEAPKDQPGAA